MFDHEVSQVQPVPGLFDSLVDEEAIANWKADKVRWTPFSGPKWGVAKVEPAELNTSWS